MEHSSLDPRLIEAIELEVSKIGQSPAVANRLVAWLDAVVRGNEDLYDDSAAFLRCDVLFEAAELDISDLTE